MLCYGEIQSPITGMLSYVAAYDEEEILSVGAVPVRGTTRELEKRILEDTRDIQDILFSYYPVSDRIVTFFAGKQAAFDEMKQLGADSIAAQAYHNLWAVLNVGWGAAQVEHPRGQ